MLLNVDNMILDASSAVKEIGELHAELNGELMQTVLDEFKLNSTPGDDDTGHPPTAAASADTNSSDAFADTTSPGAFAADPAVATAAATADPAVAAAAATTSPGAFAADPAVTTTADANSSDTSVATATVDSMVETIDMVDAEALFLEKQQEGELKSEQRAKLLVQQWILEKKDLEACIDEALKDHLELHEKVCNVLR